MHNNQYIGRNNYSIDQFFYIHPAVIHPQIVQLSEFISQACVNNNIIYQHITLLNPAQRKMILDDALRCGRSDLFPQLLEAGIKMLPEQARHYVNHSDLQYQQSLFYQVESYDWSKQPVNGTSAAGTALFRVLLEHPLNTQDQQSKQVLVVLSRSLSHSNYASLIERGCTLLENQAVGKFVDDIVREMQICSKCLDKNETLSLRNFILQHAPQHMQLVFERLGSVHFKQEDWFPRQPCNIVDFKWHLITENSTQKLMQAANRIQASYKAYQAKNTQLISDPDQPLTRHETKIMRQLVETVVQAFDYSSSAMSHNDPNIPWKHFHDLAQEISGGWHPRQAIVDIAQCRQYYNFLFKHRIANCYEMAKMLYTLIQSHSELSVSLKQQTKLVYLKSQQGDHVYIIVKNLALDPWSAFIDTVKMGKRYPLARGFQEKKSGTVQSVTGYCNIFMQENRHAFKTPRSFQTNPFEVEEASLEYRPTNEEQSAILAAYLQSIEDQQHFKLSFLNELKHKPIYADPVARRKAILAQLRIYLVEEVFINPAGLRPNREEAVEIIKWATKVSIDLSCHISPRRGEALLTKLGEILKAYKDTLDTKRLRRTQGSTKPGEQRLDRLRCVTLCLKSIKDTQALLANTPSR